MNDDAIVATSSSHSEVEVGVGGELVAGEEEKKSDIDTFCEENEETKREGDFVVVKSRRSKKKVLINLHSKDDGVKLPPHLSARTVSENRKDVVSKIIKCKDQLKENYFYQKFLEVIWQGFEKTTGASSYPEPLHILCLGLGPISSHLQTRIPRYQLGLLLLMKEELGATVELYDPVFIPDEKLILSEDFDLKVLEVNEKGKYSVESSTLAFMPHCPHWLANNFLSVNWTPEQLSKCFIICNNFSETILQGYGKASGLEFVQQANSICDQIPIPNVFKEQLDVFNNLSLHCFPTSKFKDLTEDFWLDISPPKHPYC